MIALRNVLLVGSLILLVKIAQLMVQKQRAGKQDYESGKLCRLTNFETVKII